ncbi:MAG: hypothetical protein OXC93_06110 [Rhodospirillaceae bacterium]|nr:hypothetical protein [Rhodospirillaceae bacterium]
MSVRIIAKAIFSLLIAVIFIQSLFFKFTAAPETVYIFGTLDTWAADSLGLDGWFLPPGPFNAYVIGTAELVASLLLLAGLLFGPWLITGLGALIALGVISGAIFFHLFTPLGIEVQGDGGFLFIMACVVWFCAVALLFMTRSAMRP